MFHWLASYPRSGNTFFRVLLKECFGFLSHTIYPFSGKSLFGEYVRVDSEEIHALKHSDEISWVKTHELPPDEEYPAVYLTRDGRDSLVSYTWFALENVDRIEGPISPEQYYDRMKGLICDPSPFGTWSENVQSWLHRPRTVIVRFEELIARPIEVINSVMKSLRLDLRSTITADQVPTFADLRRLKPYLFRSGKTGQWKSSMPADLQKLFWELHGETMRDLGYDTSNALAA